MSRRWSQTFACHQLDELARQLIRAPEQRRAEQVRRAEKLHDEIAPDAAYPYDYLAYRITGYRAPEGTNADLLIGQAVAPDLRLLIDNLSRSTDIRPDPGEELVPVHTLARQIGVSTKTIERWRKAGLRWRWSYDPARSAATVCIERRSLERFRSARPAAIRHATAFKQLTDEERTTLIDRARRLVQDHPRLTLHLTACRLAAGHGPSLTTVRRVLEQHEDRAAAADRLFPGRRGPLSDRDRGVIYRALRRGVDARRVAERFGKSVSAIRRGAALHRFQQLKQLDLSGPRPAVFERDDAEAVYLTSRRAAEANIDDHRPRVSTGGLGPGIAALYRQPAPRASAHEHLLRRYHYLRYRAARILADTPPRTPRVRDLDEAEQMIDQAHALRSRLIRAFLPTVLSVARRHVVASPETPRLLGPLLEAGHAELFTAFDAFDPFAVSRDFAGVLSNRLLRRFAASPAATRGRARRRDADERLKQRLIKQARQHNVELLGPTLHEVPT